MYRQLYIQPVANRRQFPESVAIIATIFRSYHRIVNNSNGYKYEEGALIEHDVLNMHDLPGMVNHVYHGTNIIGTSVWGVDKYEQMTIWTLA